MGKTDEKITVTRMVYSEAVDKAPAEPEVQKLPRCFICEGELRETKNRIYMDCSNCGHHVRSSDDVPREMVNELLDANLRAKPDLACRFQIKSAQKLRTAETLAVDIGCGSGKFLHHLGDSFSRKIGIEVSTKSIEFARNVMHLDVRSKYELDADRPDLVTFWHSMEHIPAKELEKILSLVRSSIAADGRLIVSVPNVNSFQYLFYGNKFAYFDPDNHEHEFTYKSLTLLLEKYGFVPETVAFSCIYAIFGGIQGGFNLVNPKHNHLYYRLKRGVSYSQNSISGLLFDFLCLAMLPLFVAATLLLMLVEIVFPKMQGSLTVCFKKKS